MHVLIVISMFCFSAYALFAKRLLQSVLTAPIFFLGLGYLLSFLNIEPLQNVEAMLHLVAELALIIVLFVDASLIDFSALKKRHIWPQRMLLLGLPLTVLLGTAVTVLLFPSWSIFAAALVASILAPTDAALGQAVISNASVPIEERRALTVESGLNDGLALPMVLFFACTLAVIGKEYSGSFLLFTAEQLVLGPIVGIVLGWLGANALLFAVDKQPTEFKYEGISVIALAVASYALADLVNGNGFIAAFSAGLAFGAVVKKRAAQVSEFVDSEGQILIWLAFLLIGLVLLPKAIGMLTIPMFTLIMLSLLVVRPLAIWISLIGTDAPPLARLFFGWFGPRGLATALFALLIVGDINDAYSETILVIAINAVWISALLHGVSAAPGAAWYARTLELNNQVKK